MYNCPHTGVALAVLFKLVERKIIGSTDRVVVISTAHGLKFTRFKVGYHEGKLDEVESQFANPVINLPPDMNLVRDTIAKRLNAVR